MTPYACNAIPPMWTSPLEGLGIEASRGTPEV
jgi:hypothetical protein